MNRNKQWTEEEMRTLRELYPVNPGEVCARILGRTRVAIASRAKVLKLRRIRNYKRWTPAEDERLRLEYPNTETKKLSEIFGATVLSVYQRADRLGIKKNAEYLERYLEDCGRQVSSHPRSIAARIPKGNIPSNKGLRRPGWHRGRMRETQFKKGDRCGAANRNWRPIGTVMPNGDGYLRIKVADQPESIAGKGAKNTNWEFVHRRVWEAAHGPIPKGHRIWWKDGNHLNCAIENLELLSDREHMARTTVQRFPPEIKEVIRARAQLIRRINKINGKKQTERPERSPVRDARGVEGSR